MRRNSRDLWRWLVPRAARVQASALVARIRDARLERDLADLAERPATIVAGPWLGEVGFELLYWIPFLAWFAERFQVAPDRLLVVSRGGTASWYSAFASRYAEVFTHIDPETFRREHDARVAEIGEQKQTRLTDFERRLTERFVKEQGLRGWTLIHPSRMYEALNPFWWGHLSEAWVHRHAKYRVMRAPTTDVLSVPSSYVAAKFYFNECFPPTPENRAFVRNTLATLAQDGPVLALSTALNIDDHEAERLESHGVTHLPEGIDAGQNLAVQSAVVAGARALVGTYGGFSYLAPFHEVPSFAYYSNPSGYSQKHLAMARSAFEAIGAGGLLHVHAAAEGPAPLARIATLCG